jgi:predicted membrane-bound spermidine synthase
MDTGNKQKPKDFYLFLLLSIFFISSSVISLQIVIQRFLSIALTYHFVFVVVSLALFGLSMGSFFAYILRRFLSRFDPLFLLIVLIYTFYIILFLTYTGSVYVNNQKIFSTNIYIYSCIIFFPFFFAGIYWARLFATFPALSGQLYAADLLGAASGCIGIIYLLNSISIFYAVLCIGIFPLGIITLFLIFKSQALKARFQTIRPLTPNRARIFLAAAVLVCAAFFMGAFLLYLPDISPGNNKKKEIYDALHTFGGEIIQSRDSALGRLSLIEFEKYPQLMDIYVDGTAGMPMYRFNGNFTSPNPAVQNLKTGFPGFFPLAHIDKTRKENALIIGPGGGRDVLLAKMAGFEKITAVEINPDIVSLVKEYSSFNGDIYGSTPGLELHINEGRNFLRYSPKNYDLIMFSLPVTNTSQGLGSYALTESFLYTCEALSEYVRHLSDDGRLIIVTHNDIELLRLLTITLKAFQDQDVPVSDAMQHLYVLGSDDYPVLVVKENTFSSKESQELFAAGLHHEWFNPRSSYFPFLQLPYLNNMLMELENGQKTIQDLVQEADGRGYDISPVTDQSPFFYKLKNSIPYSLLNIFYVSLMIVIFFISLPFIRFLYSKISKKKKIVAFFDHLARTVLFSLYFVFIGVGFIVLEISMIQRFMLILGNPIFSMSTIIFTLLVGAGMGSLASSRVSSENLARFVSYSSLGIITLILLYMLLLPPIFDSLPISSIALRVIFSFIMLFPLGFCMGFPLPVALRLARFYNMSSGIPWMLAINGASSVFGSAVTIILAIVCGYNATLLLAALCYLVIFIFSFHLKTTAKAGDERV